MIPSLSHCYPINPKNNPHLLGYHDAMPGQPIASTQVSRRRLASTSTSWTSYNSKGSLLGHGFPPKKKSRILMMLMGKWWENDGKMIKLSKIIWWLSILMINQRAGDPTRLTSMAHVQQESPPSNAPLGVWTHDLWQCRTRNTLITWYPLANNIPRSIGETPTWLQESVRLTRQHDHLIHQGPTNGYLLAIGEGPTIPNHRAKHQLTPADQLEKRENKTCGQDAQCTCNLCKLH